jgi:hypothetical protein
VPLPPTLQTTAHAVRTDYKNGTFTTLDGPSPGACKTTNHHGTTVKAGVTGGFQGFVDGTVTSTTYNPSAFNPTACAIANQCTRSDVIAQVFGCPNATCYAITSYNFEYNSPDQSLQYHSWHENFNKNSPTEQDIGDIANQ